MENRALRPYLVTIFLMALTTLALAYTVEVDILSEAGVRLEIPDQLGRWSGRDILYCVEPSCAQAIFLEAGENANACPQCGGALDPMSREERRILPEDTGMARKEFTHPDGRRVTASIVLAGGERLSIHRPQLCLTGAGQRIAHTFDMPAPLPGRKPVTVKVLELERPVRGPDGRRVLIPSYYAYWFAGKDRETPHHLERMFYMAADRVLRNVSHQWAYIAVAGKREPGSDAYQEEVKEFVRLFYPAIALR